MARSDTPASGVDISDETDASTVGYVGLDHHHAEPYLQTLETLPATVACACEPNDAFDVDAVASLGDVPVYGDLETMLDEVTVDAVVLTLPNRDTPAAIERALERNVDVYTEKPAARTAAELEPLFEAEARADATVCVSYPWQGHPIAAQLKSHLEDGFFGDLRSFEARFVASQLAYRNTDHFIFDADASRGGILQWLGIHWIQLLSWLLESPVSRVNASTTAGFDGVDVEDGATLQLETTDGALGTVHCGYYLREGIYDTQLNLYGNGGRSSWDPMGRTFGFDGETELELESTDDDWSATPHRTITHDYESEAGYGGAWGREFIEGFFEARETGAEPPVTLENALTVLRILDAAYESAATDQWVAVEIRQ
ncbi:Gfo/Idh/MocA family oxidoreductase [Natronococcus sp. JC468]|uniref:Gfo/Idh/MocA family protein n=1 Tax=Natronococcus sp. JC468 TaxID=1961921 RepID=UPI001438B4ED|nr:Gfo/Idh/MocA family oxidoreductase [Natronococcus sp. JC468]NKE36094.1 Gfo/Idh/MocA family oxidoreductase [Natronococcus sp. JC468]